MIEKILSKIREKRDKYADLASSSNFDGWAKEEAEYLAKEEVCEELIEIVQELAKDGGWIPCSERLPEYDEDAEYYESAIVTLDTGRVAEGCYRNYDGQWWVDAEDGEHYSINATGHVIAWQPLPAPYQKGE